MVEPVELRTERLLLRSYRLDDIDDVFSYASDPEWARYLPVPQPYTRWHAEEFVAQRVLALWENDPTWAIEFEGRIVGGVGIKINVQHEMAELGYSLAKQHWGKGLIPEASRAVLQHAFEERGLAKVFARADARNERSIGVMERLGMTREGLHRSDTVLRGERIDDVYYGLLREEWFTAV